MDAQGVLISEKKPKVEVESLALQATLVQRGV